MSQTDTEIIHSSTEKYFADVDTTDLPVVEESLIPSMIGCYTTMVRIKQANRRLENKLAATQKIMTYATLTKGAQYDNEELTTAFKAVEEAANEKLASKLPEDLRDAFKALLTGDDDEELKPLVKAADKLSALIKCIDERKAGNTEFKEAEEATRQRIIDADVPEANVFLNEFIPAYELTLDKL
jgi:hypothetical protein